MQSIKKHLKLEQTANLNALLKDKCNQDLFQIRFKTIAVKGRASFMPIYGVLFMK
jgi:hypothetical protein